MNITLANAQRSLRKTMTSLRPLRICEKNTIYVIYSGQQCKYAGARPMDELTACLSKKFPIQLPGDYWNNNDLLCLFSRIDGNDKSQFHRED